MLLENQIDEIMSRLPVHHSASVDYLQRSFVHQPDSIKMRAVRDKSGERSTRKSHSRKKS